MMSKLEPGDALEYVDGLDLPEPAPGRRGNRSGSGTVMDALDTTRKQAAIVGSEVVSFADGVPGAFRQDLVNSTLLAQLVANKKVPDRTRIFDWYDEYFKTLANIGWPVQETRFDIYVESGQNFEAHKAIITVLTAVLGAGSTALVMIAGTLQALQSMDEGNPWITLFSQESMSAESASFQVSAAETGPDGVPFVTLAAFGLNAKTKMTQVLFFKARSNDVTLRHCSSKITMNADVANAVRQPVRDKLVEHTVGYIKALPDL
jgi:hypothetical protein